MWDNAKDKNGNLTAEMVRQLFDYDKNRGILIWKVQKRKVKPGTIVQCKNPTDGYVVVGINYRLYAAHRIIWLWMTGKWPECQIDHKDRNRSNNRWDNLREATNSENTINADKGGKGISGRRGVTPRRGGFHAYIWKDRKHYHLGDFKSLDDAILARENAERKLYPRVCE